ncbi:protein NBR1 homolog isoform X2 [Rhododendron vialii]|uniref:protein NBR1 homolog isoform X2 n=1 Tax=Rhododendron vialii TaxID=182163 RepID=UPI00265E7C97|nr:protein NBR1 homolog isoform X2 [Rhododendron vialii]
MGFLIVSRLITSIMVSALVIKIKYGDSLRCFHSYVDENGLLDIDLDGLKARILYLFNLSPDANLVLTYIDEDTDNVALVDEEDFYYAIEQCLNPMMITARLDYHKRMRAREETGRSSRHSLSSVYTCFEEFLKYVPKPLQGRTSEPFDNLMNGDASSNLEFSHIVECLAKLKSGCQTIGASEIDQKASEFLETSKDTFSTPKKSLGDESIAPIQKSYQKELNKGNIDRNASTLRLDPASIHGAVKGFPKHDPIQQSPDQKFCTNPSSADVLRDSLIRPCVTGLGSLLIQDISIKDGDKMKPSVLRSLNGMSKDQLEARKMIKTSVLRSLHGQGMGRREMAST